MRQGFHILYINILVDWSLSGMTSKLVCGVVDSDFTNDKFLGHYPIHNF